MSITYGRKSRADAKSNGFASFLLGNMHRWVFRGQSGPEGGRMPGGFFCVMLAVLLAGNAAEGQLIVGVAPQYPGSLGAAMYTLQGVATEGHGHTHNEYSGPLTLTARENASAPPTTYLSYCIGLYETVGVPATYTGSPRAITYGFPVSEEPPNPPNNNLLADATRRAAVVFNYNRVDAMTDMFHGAALQAAIWESMYSGFSYSGVLDNSGVSLTVDRFNEFNALVHQYVGVVNSVTMQDPQYDAWQWVLENSSGVNQQFLITTVPEPTATSIAAVLFLGLVCGGEVYRRRKARIVQPS
jgi:hypothetical protein